MEELYCPFHGPVMPKKPVTEISVDRCPICEHALSFDPKSALEYERDDEDEQQSDFDRYGRFR